MKSIFAEDAVLICARILGMVFAIPVHEVAHAWVSEKLGDPTARQLGRISLNPIKHFQLFGLLSMLLLGFGWAKPVPVNPAYYKNHKAGMAITAAAGPLSNLILAFFSMLFAKLFLYSFLLYFQTNSLGALLPWQLFIYQLFWYFSIINISLALFNLLPVPPLDGSKIFGLLLPQNMYAAAQKLEKYASYTFFALLLVLPRVIGFSPISWLLGDAVNTVLNALDNFTAFVPKLFGY